LAQHLDLLRTFEALPQETGGWGSQSTRLRIATSNSHLQAAVVVSSAPLCTIPQKPTVVCADQYHNLCTAHATTLATSPAARHAAQENGFAEASLRPYVLFFHCGSAVILP